MFVLSTGESRNCEESRLQVSYLLWFFSQIEKYMFSRKVYRSQERVWSSGWVVELFLSVSLSLFPLSLSLSLSLPSLSLSHTHIHNTHSLTLIKTSQRSKASVSAPGKSVYECQAVGVNAEWSLPIFNLDTGRCVCKCKNSSFSTRYNNVNKLCVIPDKGTPRELGILTGLEFVIYLSQLLSTV